jgi:hypothetical protein
MRVFRWISSPWNWRASHLSNIEQPGVVVPAVVKFLDSGR